MTEQAAEQDSDAARASFDSISGEETQLPHDTGEPRQVHDDSLAGTRVNFKLNTESAGALNALQTSTGMKKTDIFNRAVQIYAYLNDEIQQGNKIVVQNPGTGKVVELKIL